MGREMSYAYFRHRLRWGHSYPVKKGALDAFLSEAGATIHFVSMWSGETPIVARAEWKGHDGRPPETAHLTLYSVASDQAQTMRELVLKKVLPALADWIRAFDSAPPTRRSENHSLEFSVQEGELHRTET
jgi:hypothetical protein